MKNKITLRFTIANRLFYLVLLIALGFAGCSDKEDEVVVPVPEISGIKSQYTISEDDELELVPIIENDNQSEYAWLLDGEEVASTLEYTFQPTSAGEYQLIFKAENKGGTAEVPVKIVVISGLINLSVEANTLLYIETPEYAQNAETVNWSVVEAESNLYRLSYGDTKSPIFVAVDEGEYSLKMEVDGVEGMVIITVVERSQPALPYITKVFDYMPGVGQFTNKMPKYDEGDTQEDMNAKVLNDIGNGADYIVTLGGYGGYAVVGFDQTIVNVKGKRDFRVFGNAFYAAANPDADAPEGGSCEPGIIMVAYDKNKNGIPDDDEWYEIAGSAHIDHTLEPWYNKAMDAGNDVNFYFGDYELTYFKPESEPTNVSEWDTYIKWEDNKGNSGYKVKNNFHKQPYYPQWAEGDKITFKGSILPANGVDESGQGSYYVLYKFRYGYADNETNQKDDSAIDIDWAVDSNGEKVHLPGVDFIKVYTGVNQENGWLGENSTELGKIEDLHLMEIDIDTKID